jgi:hypothetical protein
MNIAIKKIKNQIKDEEKWLNEAKLLLKKKGLNDEEIENHKTIEEYKKKIRELEKKTMNEHKQIPMIKNNMNNEMIEKKQNINNYDKWEDVKINNNINREYNYVIKITETMPNYIKENLKTMTNNKGYIWKGIYYFGEIVKEDISKYIFYEKNINSLLVHEITNDNYIINQKK